MGAGGGDIWQDKSKAVVYTSPNMSSHIYIWDPSLQFLMLL